MAASTEEDAWIARLRAGDDTAMNEILARYRTPVFDFCWRLLRDAGEAEDIAQETFARAYEHLRVDRAGSGKLSTWLFLVARRQCLDLLRKRARHKTDVEAEPDAIQNRTPREEAALNELAVAIASAVSALPEEQRTALILAEYEGHSIQDIAEVTETSAKSAESRLYRARQFLRQKLMNWMQA